MTLRQIGQELRKKGKWYWIRVLCIACISLAVNSRLASHTPQWMRALSFATYQILSQAGPRTAEIGHSAIVEIGDEEYWKGTLAGRRPIKRRYIADLVK